MKLTAQEVYDKLMHGDKILDLKGQIKFDFGDMDIVVRQRDVVGNIMQEWVEGWLKKNDVSYRLNSNTQMPPDFYLDPDDPTSELLEVKAFNYDAQPGFDIADFNAYQAEIIERPYMLHAKYLIFGYRMQEDGNVVIKNMWLKNVWEICRRMENWPLNLQIKKNVVHKIRPAKWYSNAKAIKYPPFGSLEDFISAMDHTVYKNPDTRGNSGTWQNRFRESYERKYKKRLSIPRWEDIEDNYVIKKSRKG